MHQRSLDGDRLRSSFAVKNKFVPSICVPLSPVLALSSISMEQLQQSSSDPVMVESEPHHNAEEAGEEPSTSAPKSALQDNLERKGKNAYYFAHAHKANGPQWDGKPEPRLLAKQESVVGHKVSITSSSSSTFDYSKSNICKYAFLDDGAKVKLYIDLENVGEKCTPDDVTLDYTDRSLYLEVIHYHPSEPQMLRFARLTADIASASFRIKTNRIIVTLTKVDPTLEWHTINDKGSPDHEVV